MSILGEPVKYKSPNFVFVGEIYCYAFVAATAAAVAVVIALPPPTCPFMATHNTPQLLLL